MKRKYENFSLPNVSDYNLWGHTTINRILRNPIYIGTLTQGKETTRSYKDRRRIAVDEEDWIVVENNHEPIISEKDFYEVQRLLDSKRRNKKEKERPIYLLQKLGAYIVVVLWYEAQQEPETINIGI